LSTAALLRFSLRLSKLTRDFVSDGLFDLRRERDRSLLVALVGRGIVVIILLIGGLELLILVSEAQIL
jgi:hypothetical protein